MQARPSESAYRVISTANSRRHYKVYLFHIEEKVYIPMTSIFIWKDSFNRLSLY